MRKAGGKIKFFWLPCIILLTKSMLAVEFSFAAFNKLPHIDELPKHYDRHPNKDLDFRGLLKFHGLSDAIAVTLTHKHIDVEAGEVIIGYEMFYCFIVSCISNL